MNDLITVQLTNEDAKLFKLFRKHQDVFTDMVNAGLFNVKNGSATLDFSPQGHMMDIRTSVVTFRRKNV
jgi:hypothetical protein